MIHNDWPQELLPVDPILIYMIEPKLPKVDFHDIIYFKEFDYVQYTNSLWPFRMSFLSCPHDFDIIHNEIRKIIRQ